MKAKTFKKDEMYEVIIPFGLGPVPEDGIFDDCPICRQLKKDLETGRAEEVEDWEGAEE